MQRFQAQPRFRTLMTVPPYATDEISYVARFRPPAISVAAPGAASPKESNGLAMRQIRPGQPARQVGGIKLVWLGKVAQADRQKAARKRNRFSRFRAWAEFGGRGNW